MFDCCFFFIAFILPCMLASALAFEAGRGLARNSLLRLPLTLALCIVFNCAALGAVGTALALWRTAAPAADHQPPPKVSLQNEFLGSASYGLFTGIVGFIWGLKHCRPPKTEDGSPAGQNRLRAEAGTSSPPPAQHMGRSTARIAARPRTRGGR